jgi:hypothetical protein
MPLAVFLLPLFPSGVVLIINRNRYFLPWLFDSFPHRIPQPEDLGGKRSRLLEGVPTPKAEKRLSQPVAAEGSPPETVRHG